MAGADPDGLVRRAQFAGVQRAAARDLCIDLPDVVRVDGGSRTREDEYGHITKILEQGETGAAGDALETARAQEGLGVCPVGLQPVEAPCPQNG